MYEEEQSMTLASIIQFCPVTIVKISESSVCPDGSVQYHWLTLLQISCNDW